MYYTYFEVILSIILCTKSVLPKPPLPLHYLVVKDVLNFFSLFPKVVSLRAAAVLDSAYLKTLQSPERENCNAILSKQ